MWFRNGNSINQCVCIRWKFSYLFGIFFEEDVLSSISSLYLVVKDVKVQTMPFTLVEEVACKIDMNGIFLVWIGTTFFGFK